MIITWDGGENFTIKTKANTVKIGHKITLGDLEINEPGEYEAGGVQIEFVDGIIQVYAEQMTIGHFKKAKLLSDSQLEKLNGIEILLIGIGGDGFSETKSALEVIGQIEPNIVIPMYSGNIDEFAKEEGIDTQGRDNLKITKAELPKEERQVVILNARR